MGQIHREGMDKNVTVPKAGYAITIGHCLEQVGVGGLAPTPAGQGQSPGGGPGGEVRGNSGDPAVHSTKQRPRNTLSWYIFICVHVLHKN